MWAERERPFWRSAAQTYSASYRSMLRSRCGPFQLAPLRCCSADMLWYETSWPDLVMWLSARRGRPRHEILVKTGLVTSRERLARFSLHFTKMPAVSSELHVDPAPWLKAGMAWRMTMSTQELQHMKTYTLSAIRRGPWFIPASLKSASVDF